MGAQRLTVLIIRPPREHLPRTSVDAPCMEGTRGPVLARVGCVAICRATLLLCACCALSACCSLGPHYRRPEIPPPPAWAAGEPPRPWPAATGGAALPPAPDTHRGGAARQRRPRAAIARVQEADAQARIAGAPLLPSLDVRLQRAATRERAVSGARHRRPSTSSARSERELRARFLGQEPRRARRRAAAAARQPLRSQTVALTVMTSVATHLFSGARAARPAAGGAATISRTPARSCSGLQARAERRHRHGARCRAAGNDGRAAECRIPPLAAAIPAERRCAAVLVGKHAGASTSQRHARELCRTRGHRRSAVGAARSAARISPKPKRS